MRELKFRVWVGDHWTDWLPTIRTLGPYNEILIDPEDIEADGVSIEQCTGLVDIDDNEIYEGDIIEWHKVTGIKMTKPVEWSVATQAFTAGDYMLNGIMGLGCRVVGNIHENPKLVKAA